MTALDPSNQGMEAQKLISISLGKMAASRVGKSGSSLHKSLLVASVLQRARHVFLEENFHNYHYRANTMVPVPMYAPHVPPPPPQCAPVPQDNDENRCATPQPEISQKDEVDAPPRMPLADTSNQQQRAVALKRRRCVSDKETQDAVSSILPKRLRSSSDCEDTENCSPHYQEENHCGSDSVLTTHCVESCASENCPPECNTSTTTTVTPSNPIYCSLEPISDDEDDDEVNSMEVEHITSLVSIFSFGAPRKDFCATQAAREDHAQFTPVALAV